MKKIIVIVICVLLLAGCGNKIGEKPDDISEEEANQIVEEAEETIREAYSIDGFEKAEYEKFNSYASENGIGDTPIYIEGKVINQTELEDGKSANAQLPQIVCIVEEDGENRWSVSYYGETLDIDDKNVRIFGTYIGFSDVFNLPSMAVGIEDEDNYDKARIEIEENGKYTEVWNWYDNYIKIELESMGLVDDSEQETQDTPELTMGQSNALESALLYLETIPFSYTGLIEQLEYEGYSTEDATYAAENCGANWNEQALKKAKSYLDSTAFSYTGLIDQLEYEGFTSEQATYGVDQCGADWNEQAVKKAESYLSWSSFSKEELIGQLEYEGFTHEQAVYGVEQNGY